MAAEGELEKEVIIHRKGYEGFIFLMKWGAIVCDRHRPDRHPADPRIGGGEARGPEGDGGGRAQGRGDSGDGQESSSRWAPRSRSRPGPASPPRSPIPITKPPAPTVGPREAALAGADVGPRRPGRRIRRRCKGATPGALVVAMFDPFRQRERVEAYAARRARGAGDGADAADHPRPVDGRALQPGQSRRLQGGPRRGGRIWPGLPDDDDRGRHHPRRAGLRDGRRSRRPAGDRHRPPPRRDRLGDRRPRRDPRADREPRRQGGVRREGRRDRGRGRRRLRDRDVGRI